MREMEEIGGREVLGGTVADTVSGERLRGSDLPAEQSLAVAVRTRKSNCAHDAIMIDHDCPHWLPVRAYLIAGHLHGWRNGLHLCEKTAYCTGHDTNAWASTGLGPTMAKRAANEANATQHDLIGLAIPPVPCVRAQPSALY